MKTTVIIFLIALLPFNASQAKQSGEESLRIVVTISNGKRLIKEIPFCSASIVKSNNNLYLASARHCFTRLGLPYLMHLAYSYVESRNMTNGAVGVYVQYREKSNYTKQIKIAGIDINGDTAGALNYEKFLGNEQDGILIPINISEEKLISDGFKILDLSKKTPAIGSKVVISGYPSGKFKKMNCTIVDYKVVIQKISQNENCKFFEDEIEVLTSAEKKLLTPEGKEEFAQGKIKLPVALSCDELKKHPGGISGGPAYSGNEFVGIVSSAFTDSKTLIHQLKTNYWSFEPTEVSEADARGIQSCYKDINEYIFMSEMNKENVSLDQKPLLNLVD